MGILLRIMSLCMLLFLLLVIYPDWEELKDEEDDETTKGFLDLTNKDEE